METREYCQNSEQNLSNQNSRHSIWGGPWTIQKLDTFEKYVKAYLTIMNRNRDKYNWRLIYFDGFAGSGSRTENNPEIEAKETSALFEADVTKEEIEIYKGAAERVIGLDMKIRGFDYYYFVETDNISRAKLESKLSGYMTEGKRFFLSDDANIAIKRLASTLKNHKDFKALAFLDPFGMQIDWETIEALSGTPVDLWILIPTGVIVNRLLERNLNKNAGLIHSQKLESFFGISQKEIIDYFYAEEELPTIFGEKETVVRKTENAIKKIADLYIRRLKTIFGDNVTSSPLVLYSSHNVPIYHFAFAAKHPLAKKIAQQIIQKNECVKD